MVSILLGLLIACSFIKYLYKSIIGNVKNKKLKIEIKGITVLFIMTIFILSTIISSYCFGMIFNNITTEKVIPFNDEISLSNKKGKDNGDIIDSIYKIDIIVLTKHLYIKEIRYNVKKHNYYLTPFSPTIMQKLLRRTHYKIK